MAVVDGALAGLSLLHDEPNYRVSQPTKVIEYLAHGVPVVTTPLPLARRLVEEVGAGVVVPFGDVAATLDAVLALDADPDTRRADGPARPRARARAAGLDAAVAGVRQPDGRDRGRPPGLRPVSRGAATAGSSAGSRRPTPGAWWPPRRAAAPGPARAARGP